MHVKDFSEEKLRLVLNTDRVRTIKMIPGSAVTDSGDVFVKRNSNNEWIRDEQDIVKVAIVERHKGTGNVGLGLLEGYGLKGGALAMTIAHDSHNIIVVGDNDRDMATAVNKLIEIGGGLALAKNGEILDYAVREIAGLMTDKHGKDVADSIGKLIATARKELKINPEYSPFMPLCFVALPVIPILKITDTGLFDVNSFCHVKCEI